MKREVHILKDEAQWLELRKKDITSTMTPALFGVSPWTTTFELYQSKRNGVEVPFKEHDRIHKGRRMEGYAAQEVAIEHGVLVEPVNEYVRIPELRMGSSYDFHIVGLATDWKGEDSELRKMFKEYGKGILEIKAQDMFRFSDKWEDGEPDYYAIQADHQIYTHGGYKWACIAPFTGVYDHRTYIRFYNKDRKQEIFRAIKEFWDMVDDGNEPEPDYFMDSDVIKAMYPEADGDIDFTENSKFDELCELHKIYSDNEKDFKEKKDAVKAELWYMVKDSKIAYGKKYKLTAGYTKGNDGVLITQDMVGERIGAREGYRQSLVKEIK